MCVIFAVSVLFSDRHAWYRSCLSVCSITFYLAVGLTALSFVLERKEGLLDRCWVAGIICS